MVNKFEMLRESLNEKNASSGYDVNLKNFIKENNLEIIDESNKSNEEYPFVKEPENLEGAKKIETPNFINNFFESKGYNIVKPKSIINNKGTTLFISSGVQILDKVIFHEQDIAKEKIFIAQPVLRTQFIDQIKEGVSTSFINISSEIINPPLHDHFNSIKDWLELLKNLGLKKENFAFQAKKGEPLWGNKKFKNNIMVIYYKGLEIGDAVYNYDIPQNNRENLIISDIGFGLERIKWILQGGSYYDNKNINLKISDYCKTLTLLAGSGLRPSNKEHGYRFRQFSKKLILENIHDHENLNQIINSFYNFWSQWANLSISKENITKIINTENERNFNRIFLDILKEKHNDVDLNINQPTQQLIKALRGTSVDEKFLKEVLNKIYE